MDSYDIIMIAAEPWEHCTWRRRHHVAWNLAKENKVLFLEPPLTIIQPFTEINLSWKHLLNLGKLKYQGRKLYSFSPLRKFPLSMPFSRIIDYDKINRKDVMRQVRNVINKLGFISPILWVYYRSYQYDYYGAFGEKLVVADWYDKFTAPSGYDMTDEAIGEIRARENRILEKADLVFAVSEELVKDVRNRNNKVFLVPQGVDINSFESALDLGNNIKKKLGKLKRPVLGFLGIMHHIVDFDLLNYIADNRSHWSILLMGREWLRNDDDISSYRKLINKENVYYVGELAKDLIPLYLKNVDVCLMPTKKIELNRAATGPLKLWEYLAAGKPIVAVDQGVKYDCADYIRTANDYADFVQQIEECLKEGNDEELVKQRKQVAKNNSWEARVKYMLDIINNEYGNK